MVLHQAPHPVLRKLGLPAAYAAAMVGGTAILIAAFTGQDSTSMTSFNGATRAEVVMQSAAERALVSPTAAVLAGNASNERRGI